jgi:hypothetical protein
LFKGLNDINTYQSDFDGNRWGDYASMMVDPANDTTFWFTNMYPKKTGGTGNWGNRIFSINLTEEVEAPYAYAGPDTTICGYDDFKMNGQAANFSSFTWATAGDGWFINDDLLNPVYLRGNNDLDNGQVNLWLTVTGYEPGTVVTDSMTLFLNKYPKAAAGPDDTLCANECYTCQGEVSFSNSYYWTSNGEGSFNDSTLLQAIYTPALSDTSLEKVVLTLHAEPLFPCTIGSEDKLQLKVESCLGVQELTAGSGLTIYPNPSTGPVTVEANMPGNNDITVRVQNGLGNTIFRGVFPGRNGRLTKHFNFGLLQPGLYYIIVSNNTKTHTVKLIFR